MGNSGGSSIWEIFTAIGTVGAVIIALFSEQIKIYLLRAKLSVEVLDPVGELTIFHPGNRRAIYYHLLISNCSKTKIVNNCRVLLKEIYKKNLQTGKFDKLSLKVPPRFIWAPSCKLPRKSTIWD